MIDEFKAKYLENYLNAVGIDEELDILFNKVLIECLDDDAEKMSELIREILDERN